MHKISTTVLICITILLFSSFIPADKWVNMLDPDLSKWQMYLSYRHSDNYNGSLPKNENGDTIAPIGYNKNESNVFRVNKQNGETVLRISGEIYGCLFTREEFENYHLKLKVKWGNKKWIPRLTKLKDSGICYHSIGECGKDYWRAWMLSQEFQIMEGHMGDYWNISSSAIDVRAFLPEGNMNTVAGNNQPFLPIGTGTPNSGFCLRTVNNESPNNDWTDIELICYQGKSIHIVNKQVVMVLANSRYFDGNKHIPLTKGKIQLQSEAAEVFYKNIQLKKLRDMPEQYKSYFN